MGGSRKHVLFPTLAAPETGAFPSGYNGSHSITPVGESRAATGGTAGRQPQAKPHQGNPRGEPRRCLLRLKPGRALVLSPRRSIEWVRNIDGRQDKTAPGDPVELGLVAKMNRAITSNGITSLRGNSYAYLVG